MNILIVGLGMIGSSYAKGLTDTKKHNVFAVDHKMSSINKAKDLGYIVDGSLDPNDFISKSDLIILSIYPNGMKEFLKTYKFNGQIVTDVTGVKCHFINDIIEDNFEFIGSHPMAGSEKVGIDACNPDVFKGANFLITKKPNNTDKAVNVLKEIATDLHFGKIKVTTPEYHDDVIAFTSQLPHAIACSLVNSDDDPDTPSNTGDSFRNLTRIASINGKLWSELFIANKENLLKHIERFQVEIEKFRVAVENSDKDELLELFRKSKEKKDGYNGANN